MPTEKGVAPVPFRVAQKRYRTGTVKGEPGAGRYPALIVIPSILLAALLAHGLCVRAIFYLDDWTQIVNNDWVDHGLWWQANQHALTYFTYWLTYALFGMSAPAFHAGNLLLHLGVAVLVSGFARTFLTEAADVPPARAQRIGWWAGLLFAVHPLCSETLNHARARDLELVTLFSLLAARAALGWRRQRRPGFRWAGAALLAVTAATFCKEVGYFLAMGSALIVWFGVEAPADPTVRRAVALPLPGQPKMPKTKLVVSPKDAAVATGNWPFTLSLTLVAGCLALAAFPAWHTAAAALRDPRFAWHAWTKGRVFWMYLQRVVVPVRLCSDHQIAWTKAWDDPVAWLAAAGVAGLIAAAWFLCLRPRGTARAVGVLLALVLLDLLHRLANPNGEMMVEARMYPAMWPLCLLIAWGIGKAEGRGQKDAKTDAGDGRREVEGSGAAAWSVVLLLVAAGIVLSARRAQTWEDPDTLVADIVAQYPLQARAYQVRQDTDVRAGRWTEVLLDQPPIREALRGEAEFNARSTTRGYDPSAALIVRVVSGGNYALALANLGQKQEAISHLAALRDENRPGDPAAQDFTARLLYAAGRVNEVRHRNDEAIDYLRESVRLGGGSAAERELRKAEAAR